MTAHTANGGQGRAGAAGGTVTRFAPSPTGALHLGHALAAVRAHGLARVAGGHFLLRIEDIDGARSRPEHVSAILDDLSWLGLAWDGPVVRQSDRLGLYDAALARLRAADLLYPCFCTRAAIMREVEASLSAPHPPTSGPDGPIYPGTCRTMPAVVRERRLAAGEPHAWRLDMAAASTRAGPLDWHDATAGIVAADPLAHGDVVLARKDAPASYHLAVTVDDAGQGVTDVTRGADLFAATDVHRLLQALLGLPSPRYHHHPLLAGPDGRRLAKRDGAPALHALRRAGIDGRVLADDLRAGRLPAGFARAND